MSLNADLVDGTQSWRCFFCDEVFTTREDAAEHFGAERELSGTACQLTQDEKGLVGLLREAWDEISRYQDDDTKLIREVHGLGAKHEREKREQEELGYARGLKDGRAESESSLAHLAAENAGIREAERNIASREVRRLGILAFLQDETGTAWQCTQCRHWTYHSHANACAECGKDFPLLNLLAFKLHAPESDDQSAIDDMVEFLRRARAARSGTE